MIVFGLMKEENENVNNLMDGVFENIAQKPRHESTRIGSVKVEEPDRPRPVKVSLSSSAHVYQVQKAARKLKDSDQYCRVFICPDRTAEERKLQRETIKQRKKNSEEQCEDQQQNN